MGILSRLFGRKDSGKHRNRKGSPGVVDVPDSNERMNWAMEKAKLTLHYFEDRLKSPNQYQEYFSIKVCSFLFVNQDKSFYQCF